MKSCYFLRPTVTQEGTLIGVKQLMVTKFSSIQNLLPFPRLDYEPQERETINKPLSYRSTVSDRKIIRSPFKGIFVYSTHRYFNLVVLDGRPAYIRFAAFLNCFTTPKL